MNENEEFAQVHRTIKRELNALEPEPLLAKPDEHALGRLKEFGELKSVYSYWKAELDKVKEGEPDAKKELLKHMAACTDFEANRGNEHLEGAAALHHAMKHQFTAAHQRGEAREPGQPYHGLSEAEKDANREVVALVTELILSKSGVKPKE